MKILCRLFGHAWVATHRNRYQIDTRQQCGRCRAVQVWKGGLGGRWYSTEGQSHDR